MIEVNAVETVTDFGWVLTFSSGERWRFDMRPYLHYLVFHRLENPGFFSWLGDKDIAAKKLYDRSVSLASKRALMPTVPNGLRLKKLFSPALINFCRSCLNATRNRFSSLIYSKSTTVSVCKWS